MQVVMGMKKKKISPINFILVLYFIVFLSRTSTTACLIFLWHLIKVKDMAVIFQVLPDIDQLKMSKKRLMSQVRMSFTHDSSPSNDCNLQPTIQLLQQSATRPCQEWKYHSWSAKVSTPIEMHILVGLMCHKVSDWVKRSLPSAKKKIVWLKRHAIDVSRHW